MKILKNTISLLSARLLITVFFTILCLSVNAQNQLLKDEAMKTVVRKGLDHVYNFQFAEARVLFEQVKTKYPEHPAYDFLMATALFWDMLHNDTYNSRSGEYLTLLNNTSTKAAKLLTISETKTEGVFFSLAAESTLTLYYSDRDDQGKTIKYARQAYERLKESMKLMDELVEFYFTTGLYNYYVVKYPETHPIYKPFMGFFVAGDKQKGLTQLDYATKNCVYTRTEALYYLTAIYLKYEVLPDKALPYAKQLVDKYPNNLYFLCRYADALICLKRYDEALSHIKKLEASKKKYFIMAAQLFRGLMAEKHYNNYFEAEKNYKAVLEQSKQVSNPSKDYVSMAYLGLGRIEARRGNKQQAVAYFKLARQNAEYDTVMREADALIKKYG